MNEGLGSIPDGAESFKAPTERFSPEQQDDINRYSSEATQSLARAINRGPQREFEVGSNQFIPSNPEGDINYQDVEDSVFDKLGIKEAIRAAEAQIHDEATRVRSTGSQFEGPTTIDIPVGSDELRKTGISLPPERTAVYRVQLTNINSPQPRWNSRFVIS